MILSFTVYGKPEPAGSKTPGRSKTGGMFVRDSNPNAADWKREVKAAAGPAMGSRELAAGPLRLEAVFYLPRPKGHYGTGRNAGTVRGAAPAYPIVKPDATKLLRAVEDALTGIVWRDDAQIVEQLVRKRYGSPARIEVLVVDVVGSEGTAAHAASAQVPNVGQALLSFARGG